MASRKRTTPNTRSAKTAKPLVSKISIIVPLYNEQDTITKLLQKVLDVRLPYAKEIIVVDDGSKDTSAAVVEKFAKKHREIKLLRKKNGGKGSALKHGFRHATGDVFIVQDADLEYDPRDYAALIAPIASGKTRVVYGSRLRRRENRQGAFMFYLGGITVTLATDILFFARLTDEPTCYKVFHSSLRAILVNAESDTFAWEPEVTAKLLRRGHKFIEIPIRYYPRSTEEGKKIKWTDGVQALTTLLKWRFKRFSDE